MRMFRTFPMDGPSTTQGFISACLMFGDFLWWTLLKRNPVGFD